MVEESASDEEGGEGRCGEKKDEDSGPVGRGGMKRKY